MPLKMSALMCFMNGPHMGWGSENYIGHNPNMTHKTSCAFLIMSAFKY